MAKGEYAIQISGKVQEAIDALLEVQKELKGVGGAVKKTDAQVKGLSLQFLAFGATLVGTTTSVAYIGAAVEKAMFHSELAISRAGKSADDLALSLQRAGRSAAELLPVGASFAQVGFAGKDLEKVSEIAFQFSRTMGMTAKEAGSALAEIAAGAGLKTVPQMRRLASGIDAVSKMFPDFSKGNIEMLRTLAPTAAQMEVNAAALSGAHIAFRRAGVSAGDARKAIGEMLENFRFGPEQIASFATAMGLPQARFEEFAAMDPSAQFREMFAVMKEGGMVTRENVPQLMSYLGVSREAADAMVKMAQSGQDVNEIFGALGSEFAKGTFLQKDFAKWTDTLYGAMDQLWQTLRGLAEETAPWLAMAFTGIIKTLEILVKIVGIIPAPIRALAVAFIGLSGAVMLTSKFLKTALIGDFAKAAKSVWQFGGKVLETAVSLKIQLVEGLKKAATAMWGYMASIAKAIWQKITYIALLVAEKFEIAFVTAERWFWIAAMRAENFITGVATFLKAAYIKVVKAEIWSTIASTAAKWALWAAQLAVNIVQGIGTGLMWAASVAGGVLTIVTGFLAAGFWALAAGVWAALAPLLPFIAIGALVLAGVVAIGYGIYKLIQVIAQNWDAIWGAATATLSAFWNVLVGVYDTVVEVGKAIWEHLIGSIKSLWSFLTGVGETIAKPFVAIWDAVKGIGNAIGSVVGSLFGSSLFHLKEGVAEVMPAMRQMEGAFAGAGRAAGKVGLESPSGGVRGRISEPVPVTTATERVMGMAAIDSILEGRQAFGGPAGSGSTGGIDKPKETEGATGAGEGVAGGGGRVVVPVTINLDGETIARAVQEYELNAGRERYMNASGEAMRGTGR